MSVRAVSPQIAPRLHHRRKIQIYFFPWILFVGAIIQALISIHIGTDIWHIGLYWGILVICFILKDLTSPHSLITKFYYRLAQMAGFDTQDELNLADETVVYINYHYPPLFAYRKHARWGLYLVILIVLGVYAIYQSQSPPDADKVERSISTFLIVFYSLLIFSRFVSMPVDIALPYRFVVWTVLMLWSASAFYICLSNLTSDGPLVINSTMLLFFILLSMLAGQRLWADRYTLKGILDELTRDLLTWPQTHQNLNGAAGRIGLELRHDRIFILIANEENSQLVIKDQFGVQKSIFDQIIPLEASICGRAFREKKSILWNDVQRCPYFYPLAEDDTAAEIAIPIQHQDIVYGILDVQSTQSGIFGPTDFDALQGVAEALGAALAASRSKTFFDGALNLWEQIDEAASAPFSSEEQVFDLFARFAHDWLHADLVIYFPLSLADCPTQEPYIRGDFLHSARISPPKSDPSSPLVCVIEKWRPIFEETVTNDSIMARATTPNNSTFIAKEQIVSSCFIPVGTRSERLGALFLNYRQPRQFDKVFQFTCLSLAQALAKATAQVRYRDILYQSFGRPEMNLHNILGRHGLKEGIMQRVNEIKQNNHFTGFQTFENHPLHDICQDVDGFMTEISLAESSIPPNFWQENLESRLRNYISSVPHQQSGRRPQIDLKLDARIERENPWVKLALYRITTEAVNNAILHGKATYIHILVQRKISMVHLYIENNGLSMPENSEDNASSNGIFHLLEELKDKFGAEVATIQNKENKKGTIVSVVHPALPYRSMDCSGAFEK